MTYREQIDMDRIPKHVAIIMDGNGRWAQSMDKVRNEGHMKGADNAHTIIENAVELGVKYLTLYTFSTENWNRPQTEVTALMELLFRHVEEEVFMKNRVRLRVIGDISRLPEKVREKLQSCIDHTSQFDRCTVVLALSYSARWEIVKAAQDLARKAVEGTVRPDDIDEEMFSSHLSTEFMPDPDLLIRTGGEVRMSNYLLWQSAYTELYFCDTYWPEFNMEELCKAIYEYQHRQRRFGKTGAQVEAAKK